MTKPKIENIFRQRLINCINGVVRHGYKVEYDAAALVEKLIEDGVDAPRLYGHGRLSVTTEGVFVHGELIYSFEREFSSDFEPVVGVEPTEIERMCADFEKINDIIFAEGALLGSDNYFKIRKIVTKYTEPKNKKGE